MFLLEKSAEHKYSFPDQNTRKKERAKKKLEDYFKIPSPELKVI